MNILCISGDIGGAKILSTIINRKKNNYIIVDHGPLGNLVSNDLPRVSLNDVKKLLPELDIELVLWSSSVKDREALLVAKDASEKYSVPSVLVLDNWMNYKKRLEYNGEYYFPNRYLLMDEYAYGEAITEGVPSEILRIVGHPCLANIQKEAEFQARGRQRLDLIREFNLDTDKKIIVFAMEPALMDQGGPDSKDYRGYVEEDILRKFCDKIYQYKNEVQMIILSHPRQNKEELKSLWNKIKGPLKGEVVSTPENKWILSLADGVVGMTSLVLYESWLLGKSVLSMQLNAYKPIKYFSEKEGIFVALSNDDFEEVFQKWSKSVGHIQDAPEDLSRNLNSTILIEKEISIFKKGLQ